MPKFIIGFLEGDCSTNPKDLVDFGTKEEAELYAEEWVEVEADSLQEAKDNYEETFDEWFDKNY